MAPAAFENSATGVDASQVSSMSSSSPVKSKVTVVGSGNWGSVAAKLIASNTLKIPSYHGELLILSMLGCIGF